jgi:hypothetical protein
VSDWLLVIALLAGIVVGRIYGWMKYHYPEFQEEIKLKVAKLRAERYRVEAEGERYRGEIDDELDRRYRVDKPW